MKKEEVIKLMKSSKSEAEWNNNCDKVKKECGGYPDFWYEEIVKSRLSVKMSTYFEYGISPNW